MKDKLRVRVFLTLYKQGNSNRKQPIDKNNLCWKAEKERAYPLYECSGKLVQIRPEPENKVAGQYAFTNYDHVRRKINTARVGICKSFIRLAARGR